MFFKTCALVFLCLSLTLLYSDASSESKNRRKRAIGGNEYKNGKWPWLVLLKGIIVTSVHPRHPWFLTKPVSCSGVLVHRRWVLTAAHCFKHGEISVWAAILGSVQFKATLGERFTDLRQSEIIIEKIVKFPYYYSTQKSNDIALVKLSRPVPFNVFVRPISLPSLNSEPFPSTWQMCVVQGWGRTEIGGMLSSRAMELPMPVLPHKICELFYSTSYDRYTNVCTGYGFQNKSVSKGDSGGPLVCKSGSRYLLAGVVIGGRGQTYPSVFTRVQPYVPWIQHVVVDDWLKRGNQSIE